MRELTTIIAGALGGALLAVVIIFAAAGNGMLPMPQGAVSGDAIHDYLLAHPSLVSEMSDKFQAQQQADQAYQQTIAQRPGQVLDFLGQLRQQQAANLKAKQDALTAAQRQVKIVGDSRTGYYGVNLATGKRLFETATSPRGATLAVAWAPDGRTFATAGLGGVVNLWNGRNGSLVRSYGGLKGKPCSSIARARFGTPAASTTGTCPSATRVRW